MRYERISEKSLIGVRKDQKCWKKETCEKKWDMCDKKWNMLEKVREVWKKREVLKKWKVWEKWDVRE